VPDHDPTILRRILALRQFPWLDTVALDELATLAHNVGEQSFRAGAVVAPGGRRINAVHMIVDGSIESAGTKWGPRHVYGALEVFAGRESPASAVATTHTRTLRMSADDLGEVLEDNFGILVAVLRGFATRLVDAGLPTHPSPPPADWPGPLGLVDRLVLLRRQLPFARARLQALAILAHASTEVSWPAGTVIAREGELASEAYAIADGHLRDASGVEPGDMIGLVETIAGHVHTRTIETVTPVRALVSSASALFDMLEDNTDLGLDIIATFARLLLDRAAGSSGYVGPAPAVVVGEAG